MMVICLTISLAALIALVIMTLWDWIICDLAPWIFGPLFLMALAPAYWVIY